MRARARRPERRRLAHDTHASRQLLNFYHSPELVYKVASVFAEHYALFGMALPLWARNLLVGSGSLALHVAAGAEGDER